MMRTCAKVRIAADNLALRLNVTKPIFCLFLSNNSDYLQKARKYGHFTGYKN